MIQGTPQASNFTPKDDIISSMPENVITHILDSLPIQDAVRTGILSRDWRFKWTMLSQLVFDDKFFIYLKHKKNFYYYYYGRIISRLLRLHKGVITKFVLYVYHEYNLNDEVLNYWVTFLSRKKIKNFTLINYTENPIKLPTDLFSCPELKHLKLDKCFVCPTPNFGGFPNLLSLQLSYVVFETYTFWEFLTLCPLLVILSLISDNTTGKIKLVEIAKLKNLKELGLPLCDLDNRAMIKSSYVLQHMSLFSKLQELILDFSKFKVLAENKERFTTPLPCLKALRLDEIDFGRAKMVSFACVLICGFPNLETLLIRAKCNNLVPPPIVYSSEVDCTRLVRLQLRCVKLYCIRGLQNEVRLMKSLLASSPLLGWMIVNADSSKVCGGYRGQRFAEKLLTLPRASAIAKIKLSWC